MGRIQRLPQTVINQIAAGEVVERPASVVKELVENALDAGAMHIQLHVRNGGRSIRVADNGSGMDAEDLQLAFHNHATSKIKDAEDLSHIESLGFRGEALASIASIAKVTCQSRPKDSTVGLKATPGTDGTTQVVEVGCDYGTAFEVNDLFYNVPARLKFLKGVKTEHAHIQEMVQQLALSHPAVRIELKLDQQVAVKTTGSGNLKQAILEVYNLDKPDQLLPVSFQDEAMGYALSGYVSTPDCYRSSRKWVNTFLNQRCIQSPIILKAINMAYEGLMTPGKFPITVLMLSLPSTEVDVNVHPSKKDVRFAQPNTIYSFVRAGLQEALMGSKPTYLKPAYTPSSAVYETMPPSATETQISAGHAKPLVSPTGGPSASSSSGSSKSYGQHTPLASGRVLRPQPELNQAVLKSYAPIEIQSQMVETPTYRIIGQLAKTYILVETPAGIDIVDQHIAAERMNFERLMAQFEAESHIQAQRLLIPIVHAVSPTLANHLSQFKTELEKLGFEFTLTDSQVTFSQLPSLIPANRQAEFIEPMLSRLEETEEVHLPITDMVATMACHSSIRAGDVLNDEQMKRVIEGWKQSKRPWTCPHGRPVSRTLSHKEIMAFFDRPSLPVS